MYRLFAGLIVLVLMTSPATVRAEQSTSTLAINSVAAALALEDLHGVNGTLSASQQRHVLCGQYADEDRDACLKDVATIDALQEKLGQSVAKAQESAQTGVVLQGNVWINISKEIEAYRAARDAWIVRVMKPVQTFQRDEPVPGQHNI